MNNYQLVVMITSNKLLPYSTAWLITVLGLILERSWTLSTLLIVSLWLPQLMAVLLWWELLYLVLTLTCLHSKKSFFLSVQGALNCSRKFVNASQLANVGFGATFMLFGLANILGPFNSLALCYSLTLVVLLMGVSTWLYTLPCCIYLMYRSSKPVAVTLMKSCCHKKCNFTA